MSTLALLLAWEDGVATRTDALLSILSVHFDFLVFFLMWTATRFLSPDPDRDEAEGVSGLGGGQ